MASDLLDIVLDGFGTEAVALLKSQSAPCRFRRGTALYRQSEPADSIFVIESGSIIVERMSPAGDITSYRIALRGDYLGHRSHFAGERRSTTPRCITDTRAIRIPGAALTQAIALDPAISLHFAAELARDDGPKLGAVLRSTRVLGIVRLAYLLHYLHDRLTPQHGAGSAAVYMPFTQNDLANMLDLRYETVSRLIHQLQDEGVVDFATAPRRIVITDRTGLREIIKDYL